MSTNILNLRKAFLGSWIGQAPYQSEPVHGKEWAFNVKLENGSIAYILSDVNNLPSQYRCPTTNSSSFGLLPGTRVKVDVVCWSNLQVIVKLEPVDTEDLKACTVCDKLDNFKQNIFDTDQSIIDFAQKLKEMVSNSEMSEFDPGDEFISKSRVALNQFLPGQSLPVSKSYESRVFIICNECQAEWILGYNFERSRPGWYKYREGFRY